MRGLRIVSVVLCLWAALAVPPAQADARTDAYHAAVAGAYRHYREAVHYLENGNVELGAFALDQFATAWRPIVSAYGTSPPPAYAKTPPERFNLVLLGILDVARKSQATIGKRPPEQIAGDLEQIRSALLLLRRINDVRVYADCIDLMNRATQRLWGFRSRPPVPNNAEAAIRYKVALYETTLWYRQCRDEAPAAYRDTEEFRRLFDGALASLTKLEGVDIAHTDALVSILRELHSFDRLIWLRFG